MVRKTLFSLAPNASLQLLPEAGAQRTLQAVSLQGHIRPSHPYGEADSDPGAAPCDHSEARHASQEGIG
jgi:hypothetical protein